MVNNVNSLLDQVKIFLELTIYVSVCVCVYAYIDTATHKGKTAFVMKFGFFQI